MKQVEIIGASKMMTSREIAEITGKEHRNVTRDIDNMIDSMHCSDLSNQIKSTSYIDKSGVSRRQYELDKEMTMTLITGYSIPLRHAVIKRWQSLERINEGGNPLATIPGVQADTAFLECMAGLLHMSASAVNQGARYIAKKHGMDENLLPSYVDDGQYAAHSATELLANHNVGITAAVFNKLLERHGILCKQERKSTSKRAINGVRTYWNVTSKGLEYGKNLSHEKTAGRETQPFWYDVKFNDLLALVSLL